MTRLFIASQVPSPYLIIRPSLFLALLKTDTSAIVPNEITSGETYLSIKVRSCIHGIDIPCHADIALEGAERVSNASQETRVQLVKTDWVEGCV